MRKFKDLEGREWKIKFTYGLLSDIEDDLGYPILEKPAEIPAGVRELIGLVWYCVKDQAEKDGVSEREFGAALDGDVVKRAVSCIIEELAVFFEALQPMASAVMRRWLEGEGQRKEMAEQLVSTLLEKPSC